MSAAAQPVKKQRSWVGHAFARWGKKTCGHALALTPSAFVASAKQLAVMDEPERVNGLQLTPSLLLSPLLLRMFLLELR